MDKEEKDQPKNDVEKIKENEASSSKGLVTDEELDALLDDALKDAYKPLPKLKPTSQSSSRWTKGNSSNSDSMNETWTEEFIKEATAQFEQKMRECLKGKDAPKSSVSSLQNVLQTATKSAVGDGDPAVIAQMNEAMKKLASGQIFKDSDGGLDPTLDSDLTSLMNSFSLGDDLKDADFEEIMPFMSNIMEKLLSKDLLFPVMTDIVSRYPGWLTENQGKISESEFDKFSKQYQLMNQICLEYDKEKADDSAETKQKRFDRITELMLKIQAFGAPPKELIDQESMDAATMAGVAGQCSVT